MLVTGAGYGLEVGLQLFVYFAIPLLCIRKLSNWELLLRLSYVIAIDPWYPRLIHWNYGGLTFSQFPFLEQVAGGSRGVTRLEMHARVRVPAVARYRGFHDCRPRVGCVRGFISSTFKAPRIAA